MLYQLSYFQHLARRAGFEPTSYNLEDCRVLQLHHRRIWRARKELNSDLFLRRELSFPLNDERIYKWGE